MNYIYLFPANFDISSSFFNHRLRLVVVEDVIVRTLMAGFQPASGLACVGVYVCANCDRFKASRC